AARVEAGSPPRGKFAPEERRKSGARRIAHKRARVLVDGGREKYRVSVVAALRVRKDRLGQELVGGPTALAEDLIKERRQIDGKIFGIVAEHANDPKPV